jgi:hypothetical protein
VNNWEEEYQRRLGVLWERHRPGQVGAPPFTVTSEGWPQSGGCDTCGYGSETGVDVWISDARGRTATVIDEPGTDGFGLLMRLLSEIE